MVYREGTGGVCMCCDMRACLLDEAVFCWIRQRYVLLEKKRKREKLLGSVDSVTNKRKAECVCG